MDLNALTQGVKGLLFGPSNSQNEQNQDNSSPTIENQTKSLPIPTSPQNSALESDSPGKKKRGQRKKNTTSPNSRQKPAPNHEFEALDGAPTIPTVTENGEAVPLRTRIMKQLEHYFSDENLSKDKFLIKEFERDESGQGYINIEILAGFPRMKAMSSDLDELRNAIKESTIIKLSKNGEKVKRIVPYALPLTEEQKERRTVYVSYLPKHSDQESVRGIFGICGVIKRIDLPVDKKSGEIKGIAFVEFESRKQARKALAYFSDKNNDFFKLGMRVRQYATKSGSQVNSPEAMSPLGQSPGGRASFLQGGFQMTPEMIQQFQDYGYIVTPAQPNVAPPFVPYNQNVLFPQQQTNQRYQHQNASNSSSGYPRDRDHHSGGRQQSNSFSHNNNRENQGGHHNSSANSYANSSIYEAGAPTFNYSKQNDKRKKRSVSQPPGVHNESGHQHLPGLGHVHHKGSELQHSSSTGERPRLQLRPRSESVGGGSGIVPSRQPKGPDGSKGFPAGRGKLIFNQ
eukprot:TRINITY_DN1441_c0_g1_i1.p1 TRINITY_DN1441_c0_g1~~TRINITY_DN1441_c0_g1_i1.p1  ORF type:complete len:513 (-),score=196.36 TRINITY_DN1441_c0_g1_i1:264-1802(-)